MAASGVYALAKAVEKALKNMLLGQELAPLDSCVVFMSASEDDLGFDHFRYPGSDQQYTVRRTIDEQEYYVPHKAIISGTTNTVKVVLPGSKVPEGLKFKTETDTEIVPVNNGNTDENGNAILELTVDGINGSILAYDSIFFPGNAEQADTTAFMCTGELTINSYPAKTKKVVLVPVNGADRISGNNIEDITEEMATAISNIYAPANMDLTVEMGENIIVNAISEGMEDSDNKILTRFTSDMNLVIDAFEGSVDAAADTYYMFLVNKSDKTTKDGYMPFQQRYGFLTVEKDISKEEFIRTTAHELGHGAFNLRHPFSEKVRYPLLKNTTDNLMDYNNGNNLFNYQWDLVQDPKFMLTWFMSEEEAMMSSADECWQKGRENWTKVTPQKYRAKKKLEYDATCSYEYSSGLYRTYINLTDGNILIVDQAFRNNTYSSDPDDLIEIYHFYVASIDEWFEVDIDNFETECLSCDLNFIATEIVKLTGKTIGRYVLPIEDIYILIEGKDFDGAQANRAVAGGFILIEFIPGGKLLKPVTKGLKAGTKATVKGTRKIYKFVKGTKVVVGEFADDVLKPAKWIDGEADEVLETLSDVTYVGKDGKQAKGTVQVVKQGSEVGFKKVVSTLDEFWAQIPASYLEGIKKAFNGTPVLKYADEDMVFYRRWGGDAKEVGSWLSPTKYEKAGNARRYLALPDGNTAENISAFKIKKGTPYIDGKAASQIDDVTGTFGSYAEGGGNQIYILYEDWNKLIKL